MTLLFVSIPLPGFINVKVALALALALALDLEGFNPVAGIH